MSKKNDNIAAKYVAGFGLMEGAGIATGLGVNSELVKAIGSTINLNPILTAIFATLISIIAAIITLCIVYGKGGRNGLIAVFLGIFAGILAFSLNQIALTFALIFLVLGILLGQSIDWK